MEINEPLDSEINSLDVTPESRAYLLEAAKWGRFVSIVGFVFMGLFLLLFLFMGGTLLSLGGSSGMEGAVAGAGFGIFLNVVITMVIMFFPNYYMYNFSTRVITAVNSTSTLDLTDGLKNLKSLFKFYGILMVISIAFLAIMFLFFGGMIMSSF